MVLCCATANAEQDEAIEAELERQLGEYDLGSWDLFWAEAPPELKELWGGQSVNQILETLAHGSQEGEYAGKLEGIFGLLAASVRENIATLGVIVAIALISGLVGILLSGSDSQDLQGVTSFVCYGLYVTAVAYIIASLVSTATQTVVRLSEFSEAVTPVLAVMLTAAGATASAGIARPLAAFMSETVISIFQGVILPLVVAATLLAIAGNLAGKSRLKQLTKTLKSIVKWVIGIVFTVYLGIVSIQGVSVAGVDSISIRTLKYTLGSTVPVVGGVVSGTLDTTRGCAVLIKNAAGITAVIVGIGIMLMPVLKIAAASIALKLTAAICEPIADDRMGQMTGDIADSCNYLIAVVVVTALMFVITVALFISAGNLGI